MRTALFGGTFDPMHKGHIKIVETMLEQAKLEAVVVMPAGVPYHKASLPMSPSIYRYELCKTSLKKMSKIMLSDMELERASDTYTIDTVEALQKIQGKTKRIYLIQGSDIVFTIETWHRFEDLLAKTKLLLAFRPSDDRKAVTKKVKKLTKKYNAKIKLIEDEQLAISSSQIREAVRAEHIVVWSERLSLVEQYLAKHEELYETVREQLAELKYKHIVYPANWQEYMEEKSLHFIEKNEIFLKEQLLLALRPETKVLLNNIERELLTRLSHKRIVHSWNTMFCALEMALRFDVDPDKVAVAALAHDIAKELHYDKLLDLVPVEERQKYSKLSHAILHGPAGAHLFRQVFNIDDEEIFSAIYYHTTLHDAATSMDRLIFLADKIEPGRSFRDLKDIRDLAKKDLKVATLACLKDVERYLLRENLKFHPMSKEALSALISDVEADPKARKNAKRYLKQKRKG